MVTRKNIMELQEVLFGKKITILGHDNIDVDSVLSALLTSKLLRFLGVENEFLILDEVKEDDTYNILKELFGIDLKVYQRADESEDRNLLLLDHYETAHKGKVLACIDHHPTSKTREYGFMYVRNSCATAYLVYELMKMANYTLLNRDIKMVVAAMLIDTVSFRSTKTLEEEVIVAIELAKRYKIDIKTLEQYGLGITEIDKLTDEEIISNGEKWYSYRRKNDVASSYLQVYGMPNCEILHHWMNLLSKKLIKTEADMLVFLIFDIKAQKTHEYRITVGKTVMICHDGILSRGKDIMPKVEACLLNSCKKGESA